MTPKPKNNLKKEKKNNGNTFTDTKTVQNRIRALTQKASACALHLGGSDIISSSTWSSNITIVTSIITTNTSIISTEDNP